MANEMTKLQKRWSVISRNKTIGGTEMTADQNSKKERRHRAAMPGRAALVVRFLLQGLVDALTDDIPVEVLALRASQLSDVIAYSDVSSLSCGLRCTITAVALLCCPCHPVCSSCCMR